MGVKHREWTFDSHGHSVMGEATSANLFYIAEHAPYQCDRQLHQVQLWRRKCPNLHTSHSAIALNKWPWISHVRRSGFLGGSVRSAFVDGVPRHRRDGITSSTVCKTTTYAWWSWCSWRLNLHWGAGVRSVPDGSMPKCGSHFAPSPILNPAATANAIDELRHGHTSPTWMWCRATPVVLCRAWVVGLVLQGSVIVFFVNKNCSFRMEKVPELTLQYRFIVVLCILL